MAVVVFVGEGVSVAVGVGVSVAAEGNVYSITSFGRCVALVVSDDLKLKRSLSSFSVTKMNPLLVKAPLVSSWILAVESEICFSILK